MITKNYAINYIKLQVYTFEMLHHDDGGRRTKHLARNVICIYVFRGGVFF